MEVAGQWRREWAGTAEYGKVIEGGVTRRVARAMEVLQASGPGARVRVLRAAYHSTAGPGAPASSFMMHSSRRVISSGSRILESPTYPTAPLEISSMPLDLSPERSSESENYKVTEPDDIEISQPSKWKGSTSTASARMASEESSSIDNTSIIDVDTKMSTMKQMNFIRKSSLDSDISDSIQSFKKNTSRASPLLDTPVTLSTLKYKSLLNGNNNNWNDRRKSYSFEDTSPIHETISKDSLGMESSTDSGICKSTEKVDENDDLYQNNQSCFGSSPDNMHDSRFQDWLASNRPNKWTRVNRARPHWEDLSDNSVDNVTLQSNGKVSIALPQNSKINDKFQYIKNYFNEFERKTKRVEFSKTELHFAADSGKVNIISTDDKPPPSSDFRRRRSAFVPLREKFERPITLFGEKPNDFVQFDEFTNQYDNDETEENTVTAKSILKNKIPKPKPYLLGENMEFRKYDDQHIGTNVTSAVSLINSQLRKEDFRYSPIETDQNEDREKVIIQHPIRIEQSEQRAIHKGHNNDNWDSDESFKKQDLKPETRHNETCPKNIIRQQELQNNKSSPVLNQKTKTRRLRDSDLTYFGVDSPSRNNAVTEQIINNITNTMYSRSDDEDDYFRSVKLVQQVSNSISNSEAESEDNHEYQNIPIITNRPPVPTPKPRSKYFSNFASEPSGRVVVLKPIIEQETDTQNKIEYDRHRSRFKSNEKDSFQKARSISEPPKFRKQNISPKLQKRSKSPTSPTSKQHKVPGYLSPSLRENFYGYQEKNNTINPSSKSKTIPDNENPIYENVLNHANKKSERPERSQIIYARNKIINENKSENERIVDINISNGKGSREETPEMYANSTDTKTRKNTRLQNNQQESNSTMACESPRIESVYTNDKLKRNTKHEVKRLSPEKENRNSSLKRNQRSRSSHFRSPQPEFHTEKRTKSHDRLLDRNSDQHRQEEKSVNKKTGQVKKDKTIDDNGLPSSRTSSKSTEPKRSNRPDDKTKTYRDKRGDSKRREIVINYDDKNGTVSTVSKIKSGAMKPKTFHPAKEITKEKKSSLKSQDQHESRIEHYNNQHLKRIHKERTCSIL